MQQVSAHVLSETGQRGSNPSIVATTAGVVVIDTAQLPSDAIALRSRAESMGRIEYLINTEHHADHIFGNYFFKGAGLVVHHQEIFDSFMVPEPPIDPYEYVREAARVHDPKGYALVPDRDTYFQDPNKAAVTFSDDLVIRLGDHTFELLHTPGHTPGQTAVFVPEERVVFTGDTVFSGCQTWLMTSDLNQWLVALDRIAGLDVDFVVPGHGPVTTPAYLRTQRATLLEWMSAVADAVARGWTREETIERIDPGAGLPVDIGLESMKEHIHTQNAGSLWDKLTASR
ncbi:MBL fold metallo-hydrolase [Rhodococcus sp. 06-462-5]|uniref:MBL fold metallo-hydrolase n=1 Tax=unclassified Rhodococcus (in: high G+C Gram-positive bacteria) TaxID=192944 RepID=UPI000B9B5333|nr:MULTISPECIES: MBL fold metallo-hydrolase [unclassified Rhodococcus (in: high G+C Gram-positive bacteria)]OZC77225.1 MBL fold metallo-hydrolase [Rhodococcus sp. 06-462-5]OZE63382.1 MBL fold metallo-hydrolase [Rhodococcus sp. 02-925g]